MTIGLTVLLSGKGQVSKIGSHLFLTSPIFNALPFGEGCTEYIKVSNVLLYAAEVQLWFIHHYEVVWRGKVFAFSIGAPTHELHPLTKRRT